MTPEATHTPTPPPPSCATGAPSAHHCHHAAALAATPIRDLVATARTFYAAINSRHSGISDDDMAALASFDNVLSLILASRPASTAEEAAMKAEYLTRRVQAKGMSAEAEAAALEAIRADATAVAASPKADAPSSEPLKDALMGLDCELTPLLVRLHFLYEFFTRDGAHMDPEALHLFLGDAVCEAQAAVNWKTKAWVAAGGSVVEPSGVAQ